MGHGIFSTQHRPFGGRGHGSHLDFFHHCGASLRIARAFAFGHCLRAHPWRKQCAVAMGLVAHARSQATWRKSGLFVWFVALAFAHHGQGRHGGWFLVCRAGLHRLFLCACRARFGAHAWQLAALDQFVDVVVFARANWHEPCHRFGHDCVRRHFGGWRESAQSV